MKLRGRPLEHIKNSGVSLGEKCLSRVLTWRCSPQGSASGGSAEGDPAEVKASIFTPPEIERGMDRVMAQGGEDSSGLFLSLIFKQPGLKSGYCVKIVELPTQNLLSFICISYLETKACTWGLGVGSLRGLQNVYNLNSFAFSDFF